MALRCEPCIQLHGKKCVEAGATREQVLEAACVAVMMGGGPVYTHVPIVIDTPGRLGSGVFGTQGIVAKTDLVSVLRRRPDDNNENELSQ